VAPFGTKERGRYAPRRTTAASAVAAENRSGYPRRTSFDWLSLAFTLLIDP